jgi:hypothetical protein
MTVDGARPHRRPYAAQPGGPGKSGGPWSVLLKRTTESGEVK